MPIKTITTTVRPNTNVGFFAFTEEQNTHFTNVYVNTGKMSRTISRSPDNLVRVVERLFATVEDFEAYKADPVTRAASANRDAYNQANNHIITQSKLLLQFKTGAT